MIISEEQQQIVNHKKEGKNIIVDACAGSGKSTTIISLAKECPDETFLIITYNSMLRLEFKEKLKQTNIKNIEVHTFHSLAVRYFLPSANTDSGIRKILYNNMPLTVENVHFRNIGLDESQDMTLLYYKFIIYFICKLPNSIQLIVLGDYMQGLYEFKGSDTRFLTHAEEIWRGFPNLISPEFVKCTLRTSYRVTNQIADFVNHTMLGEVRLEACREGDPVHYIRYSMYNMKKIIIFKIKEFISMGYLPSDIFVLGASVKGTNSNIRNIENSLTEAGIPCMVPMLETEQMDDRVIQGKVVFSSFHSVKGRQRKIVIIVGFDNSYLTFYARNLRRDICPNTLYVGTTRATEKLFVLERDERQDDCPLEFLKMEHYEMKNKPYISFKGMPKMMSAVQPAEKGETEKQVRRFVTPTDLTRFLPENVVEEISPILDRIFIKNVISENAELKIPSVTETKLGFFEDVSDINGIAIPCMYYDIIQRLWNTDHNIQKGSKNILYSIIENTIDGFKSKEHGFLRNVFNELDPICKTTSEYLYMANVYLAVKEGLYFKLKQINKSDEYNWITDDIREKCSDRLSQIIGNECAKKPEFEVNIIKQSDEFAHSRIDEILSPFFKDEVYRFTARIDIITENTIWELKCTSCINIEHQIQVIIYAWLSQCVGINKPCKILNIKTGEIWELKSSFDELTDIVVKILKSKYNKPEILSDDEFIEICRAEIF